jgi:hypothetical protein
MEDFAMNTATAMNAVEAESAKHYRWEELPAENLKDGLTRRLITGDRMMIAHVYFKKGIDLDVDVFNPPRQDWLAGTDAYLRR